MLEVKSNLPSHQNPVPSLPHETEAMGENDNKTKKNLLSLLTEPIQWIQSLSSQLNPTFVIGVFIIYGIGQGFSGSLFKVVVTHFFLYPKMLVLLSWIQDFFFLFFSSQLS